MYRISLPRNAANTVALCEELLCVARIDDGRAIFDANLTKDSVDMTLDGLFRQAQLCGDFLIRQSTAN